MSRLPSLPRGVGSDEDAARATGRWAAIEEIAAHAYQPGQLYLGTLPYPSEEAWPELQALETKQASLAADTSRPAALRQADIDALQQRIEELCESGALDIGIADDRHHLIFAGSRAGKSTTILIPNLQRYPGAVIVTDPKGELASKTAAHRAASIEEGGLGQNVLVMDPYNTSNVPESMRASWNPLDLIDPEDELAVDVAASIAEAVIIRSNEENAHFDDSARSFIKGLTLFTADAHAGRVTRNLVTVYSYLMRGATLELARDRGGPPQPDDPSPFDYLLRLMQRCEAFDGVVSGAAEALLSLGQRERGSVLSTARRSMEFLERRPMRRLLSHSSFDLDSLKTDPKGVSLYLCLPPQRMSDCGRFLRLMIAMTLERLYALPEAPATGHPVLAMLEEFPVLGHMPLIEQAAGYAAGFGLKLLIVCQDLTQLKRHYREGWETFLGNAGCIQAFANADVTTLEYLSKKLGECEITQVVRNLSSAAALSSNEPGAQSQLQSLMAARGPAGLVTMPLSFLSDPTGSGQSLTTTESWNSQRQRTPLLLPDEIARLFAREANAQIVLISGQRPWVLGRQQ
ncbi:MAG: hypothetical protein Kilf2KO_34840 [Rhodospirillales bacterium]